MDWERYWNEAPVALADDDFLRQVGKTVGGVPVGDDLLQIMVDSAIDALDIDDQDQLLDLCCGNGLLTTRLAPFAGCTVGVDYSARLIDVARRHHAETVRYVCGSVLDVRVLARARAVTDRPFTKILIHEALQHFSIGDLGDLFEGIESVATPDAIALFASVPDRTRQHHFYDTPERQAEHRRRVAAGTEAIGTWWDPSEIAAVAADRGHGSEILSQNPALHTAHYRFDVRIRLGTRR